VEFPILSGGFESVGWSTLDQMVSGKRESKATERIASMNRRKLTFQAFLVTLMGFFAHITAPDASAATRSNACPYWDRCTGVCGVANPCAEDCAWGCMQPGPENPCGLVMWWEVCFSPT
jgi:hypothetical protein